MQNFIDFQPFNYSLDTMKRANSILPDDISKDAQSPPASITLSVKASQRPNKYSLSTNAQRRALIKFVEMEGRNMKEVCVKYGSFLLGLQTCRTQVYNCKDDIQRVQK